MTENHAISGKTWFLDGWLPDLPRGNVRFMASNDRPTPAPAELSSWKQIGTYLNVSVRTVQSWERERGLPVRRLPGGRGRVYATVEDIDNWKYLAESKDSPSEMAPPLILPKSTGWFHGILRAGLFGIGAVALLVVLSGSHFISPIDPVSYRLERNTLVVVDGQGHELWHRVFPYDLLDALQPQLGTLSSAWIGDLDGDGHAEVLFLSA